MITETGRAISLFESLTGQYNIGREVALMHAYRFREPTMSAEEILQTPIAKASSLRVQDVLTTIDELQNTTEGELVLTGGWATVLHTQRQVRPTSSEIDLLAYPHSLTSKLRRQIALHFIPDWGCRIGFHNLPNGKKIRVEINTIDILPEITDLNVDEHKLVIASPSTITLGKMARSLNRGVKERDRLDISSLILSKHSSALFDQLMKEVNLNRQVWDAWNALNLPDSVEKYFSSDELETILKFSNPLKQLGSELL